MPTWVAPQELMPVLKSPFQLIWQWKRLLRSQEIRKQAEILAIYGLRNGEQRFFSCQALSPGSASEISL